MLKIIKIIVMIVLIWLGINALHITDVFIDFLLVGKIPGFETNLSPTLMLAIITTTAGAILFEFAAKKFMSIGKWRKQVLTIFYR